MKSHDQTDKRKAKNQYKSKKHQQIISIEKRREYFRFEIKTFFLTLKSQFLRR